MRCILGVGRAVQGRDNEFVTSEAQGDGKNGGKNGGRRREIRSDRAAQAAAAATFPPVWLEDSAAPECPLCGATFALLRRRHHCRNCGTAVCDSCSSSRWPHWALPELYRRFEGTKRLTSRNMFGLSATASREADAVGTLLPASTSTNSPQRVCGEWVCEPGRMCIYV